MLKLFDHLRNTESHGNRNPLVPHIATVNQSHAKITGSHNVDKSFHLAHDYSYTPTREKAILFVNQFLKMWTDLETRNFTVNGNLTLDFEGNLRTLDKKEEIKALLNGLETPDIDHELNMPSPVSKKNKNTSK